MIYNQKWGEIWSIGAKHGVNTHCSTLSCCFFFTLHCYLPERALIGAKGEKTQLENENLHPKQEVWPRHKHLLSCTAVLSQMEHNTSGSDRLKFHCGCLTYKNIQQFLRILFFNVFIYFCLCFINKSFINSSDLLTVASNPLIVRRTVDI